MSDWSNYNTTNNNQGSSGGTDIVTALANIARQLSTLITQLGQSATYGTFTFPAAATVTVTEPAVTSTSSIKLIPLNASAAILAGSSKNPFVSTKTPGASFVVSTGDATNAAGTEIFQYVVSST